MAKRVAQVWMQLGLSRSLMIGKQQNHAVKVCVSNPNLSIWLGTCQAHHLCVKLSVERPDHWQNAGVQSSFCQRLKC